MNISGRDSLPIYLLILLSGFASLAWQVIWQLKSSLALGVSAWGAAITLAVVMGGMSIGGFVMGHALRDKSVPAVRVYGSLEIIIGLTGLFFNTAFLILEKIDTWSYAILPNQFIYIFGIIALLGIPTICMGATLPVFGLIAKQFKLSISKIYSINTFGAAVGILFAALILIPWVGVTHTIWIISAINIFVGITCWLFISNKNMLKENEKVILSEQVLFKDFFIVFVTGFATFTLEIAWFRSLASTFPNTTDIFAIMLACILIAIGLAAKNISKLKSKTSLATHLWFAGILILLVTPLIERFDVISYTMPSASNGLTAGTLVLNYTLQMLVVFGVTYFVIVPPMQRLSIAFPWILDNQYSPRSLGKLYALNTFAAIIGALGAAWVLLPTIGFAKTAWIAGGLVVIAGIMTSDSKRFIFAASGIAALLIAICLETGIGKTRVQGFYANLETTPAKVLESFEGPESTVSAIEYKDGARLLLINSSSAAGESGTKPRPSIHYMAWMGHLPMLIHPNPQHALVIGFGTGQTANAVRKENPQSLDIVEINPQILKLAHNFRSNENVLSDAKVKSIIMDGRAYLRRNKKVYDIITLEPMPPIMAGVNALYSKEFYLLARNRLSSNGVIAQWLPFHSVAPYFAASIAKTFQEIFPNAILWIDTDSKNGILLGSKDASTSLVDLWPGFIRTNIKRNLSIYVIQKNIILNPEQLKKYGDYGRVITDDNQLLSYGKALYAYSGLQKDNFALIERMR